MNKTKRIFVAAILALVSITCVIFAASCSNSGSHKLTKVAAKQATCTADGNVEYYTCADCDELFVDAEGTATFKDNEHVIKAFGHTIVSKAAKAATCYSEGTEAYWTCRTCNTLYSNAEATEVIQAPVTIAKTQHSIKAVPKKNPVGATPGYEAHYACGNCNKLYTDAAGTLETSMEKLIIAGEDFDYKIPFTPAMERWESINGTNGINYISVAAATGSNGFPAAKFTIKSGATSGMEIEAWLHNTVKDAMNKGANIRIPTVSGKTRQLELNVTNNGGQTVSFRYYAESYGDKGGVEISIASGESKTVSFEVNPGQSIGCNYAFKLLSDVSEETKITMYGYFYCEGEVDSISLYRDADKKNFKVGDSFTSDGVVVKAKGASYDEVVIANYMTDLEEGYVFTAEDIGTKTVTVAYGEYTTSYQITITA